MLNVLLSFNFRVMLGLRVSRFYLDSAYAGLNLPGRGESSPNTEATDYRNFYFGAAEPVSTVTISITQPKFPALASCLCGFSSDQLTLGQKPRSHSFVCNPARRN
jgi:hypothetical protein